MHSLSFLDHRAAKFRVWAARWCGADIWKCENASELVATESFRWPERKHANVHTNFANTKHETIRHFEIDIADSVVNYHWTISVEIH